MLEVIDAVLPSHHFRAKGRVTGRTNDDMAIAGGWRKGQAAARSFEELAVFGYRAFPAGF
jgi:hypothetical protein